MTAPSISLTDSQQSFYSDLDALLDDHEHPEVRVDHRFRHNTTRISGRIRVARERTCPCGSSKHVTVEDSIGVGAEWRDGRLRRAWPAGRRGDSSQSLTGALRMARLAIERWRDR